MGVVWANSDWNDWLLQWATGQFSQTGFGGHSGIEFQMVLPVSVRACGLLKVGWQSAGSGGEDRVDSCRRLQILLQTCVGNCGKSAGICGHRWTSVGN